MATCRGENVATLLSPTVPNPTIAEQWMDSIGRPCVPLSPSREPRAPSGTRRFSTRLRTTRSRHAMKCRALSYMKTRELYDQATIMLTAIRRRLGDHGEQGHGLLLHDEMLRVPLIIKPPNGGHAGRRVTNLVQHVDLVPTVLDLAKAPIPGNLRGRSLAPLFEPGGSIAKTAVYSESVFGRQQFGGVVTSSPTGNSDTHAPREELYGPRARSVKARTH